MGGESPSGRAAPASAPAGGAAREPRARVAGEKNRDGSRGQRQADEPAADRQSPPSSGEARGLDQQRAGDNLEDQRVHSRIRGSSLQERSDEAISTQLCSSHQIASLRSQ